ncbi:tetratricopeptide repeat protein [Candidatus Riflebacteria bacterium]
MKTGGWITKKPVTFVFLLRVFFPLLTFLLIPFPGYPYPVLENRVRPKTPALKKPVSSGLKIIYPLADTIFPAEIIAPTFRWQEKDLKSDYWELFFIFQDKKGTLSFQSQVKHWTPSKSAWEEIKKRSTEKTVLLRINGKKKETPLKVHTRAQISIMTSIHKAGAPIFYREVNLPFSEAVKDPAKHIRWRFGTIDSSEPPAIVLEKIPTCANCHSFSTDGRTLAMEIDSANDKGSYVIAPISEQMVFDKEKVISWSDYKREENEPTFGLLAQISPDGRYVVCTVKDRSVFVARPDLAFSQLFFPVKGILCYYDRQTKSFHSLPGADDKNLVQSNPAWSPDGKYLVFARTRAYVSKALLEIKSVLLTPEQMKGLMKDFKSFKFDLFRLPFNNGRGGLAEPLKGASNNGMSNFFPKYSPDGKWIIFCKAQNYMLLQPDSELYIIPSSGGSARRLRCNTTRMNSWHSWSPNSRWLIFSSKVNSLYTQLFLTHIDEQGKSSPPVVLDNFAAPNRAANIPEFVNTKPGAIKNIRQKFVDDLSFIRAATMFANQKDFVGAEKLLHKAVKFNPRNIRANLELSMMQRINRKFAAAEQSLRKVINLKPEKPKIASRAHNNLGIILLQKGMTDEALGNFRKAVAFEPNSVENLNNLARLLSSLGIFDEAIVYYKKALKYQPDNVSAYNGLGTVFARKGDISRAIEYWKKALSIRPDFKPARSNLLRVPVPFRHLIDKDENIKNKKRPGDKP